MGKRIVTTGSLEEDVKIENHLRPQRLQEYIGQEKAKDYMELLLQSGLYSQKNSIIYQFPRRTLKLYDLPVSAGTGQFLDSDSFSEMEVGNEVSAQADFGVRVSGDSMEPLYLNGQIIWIHRQDTLEDGDIGIFFLDGELAFS